MDFLEGVSRGRERPQWFSYRIRLILGKDKSLCLLQNDIRVICLQFNDFLSVLMPSVWLLIVVHLLFIRCACYMYVSVYMHRRHMVVSLCVSHSVILYFCNSDYLEVAINYM